LSEISCKYKNLHKGDIINILVSELSLNSKRKIDVKCDICGKEKKLCYAKYLKNITNCNFYACSSKCAQEKVKKTCLINFGVTNASFSDEKKKKRVNTNIKKFGESNPFSNKEIQKKLKEISIEKYGTDNIFGSETFKKSMKIYNLEKYGVEYISQVPELYMKQQKSGYRLHFHDNTKLFYRGTYEKDFLDFCFSNKIVVKQGKRIKYFFESKEHYYFSDYYIESKNLIVEIKSSWTYNKYIDKNLIKQKTTIENGYNYLFIIDKKYKEFEECLK
jgi:hypothetical protein